MLIHQSNRNSFNELIPFKICFCFIHIGQWSNPWLRDSSIYHNFLIKMVFSFLRIFSKNSYGSIHIQHNSMHVILISDIHIYKWFFPVPWKISMVFNFLLGNRKIYKWSFYIKLKLCCIWSMKSKEIFWWNMLHNSVIMQSLLRIRKKIINFQIQGAFCT